MDESSSKKPHGGDVLPSLEGDETCYLFCEDCAAELRISPQAGLSPAEAGPNEFRITESESMLQRFLAMHPHRFAERSCRWSTAGGRRDVLPLLRGLRGGAAPPPGDPRRERVPDHGERVDAAKAPRDASSQIR